MLRKLTSTNSPASSFIHKGVMIGANMVATAVAQTREWGLDLDSPDERPGTTVEDLPDNSWSVLPKAFGEFYIRLFDSWV